MNSTRAQVLSTPDGARGTPVVIGDVDRNGIRWSASHGWLPSAPGHELLSVLGDLDREFHLILDGIGLRSCKITATGGPGNGVTFEHQGLFTPPPEHP